MALTSPTLIRSCITDSSRAKTTKMPFLSLFNFNYHDAKHKCSRVGFEGIMFDGITMLMRESELKRWIHVLRLLCDQTSEVK